VGDGRGRGETGDRVSPSVPNKTVMTGKLRKGTIHSTLRLAALAFASLFGVQACRPQTNSHFNLDQRRFWIVFDYNKNPVERYERDLGSDIYLINDRGTGLKAVTTDHRSWKPSWSPNGKELLFLRRDPPRGPLPKLITRNDIAAIYALFTRQRLVRLNLADDVETEGQSFDKNIQAVAWYPDGKHIIVRISDRFNLEVIPVHGSQAKIARFDSLLALSRSDPTWRWPGLAECFPPLENFLPLLYANAECVADPNEPARTNLPFQPDLEAYAEVSQFDPSGVTERAPGYDATWSRNGKSAAYSSFAGGEQSRLYVSDGNDAKAEATAVTNPEIDAHDPAWSNGGSRIAFSGRWKDSSQIFVANRDGSGLVRLSHNANISCGRPSWSPDDKWIVAGCGERKIAAPVFGDAYFYNWTEDVYVFDVQHPTRGPRVLTNCWERSTPNPDFGAPECRARNPVFIPGPVAAH